MNDQLKKISAAENLDVITQVRNASKDGFVVEASITRFKMREEKEGTDVLKKVTVSAFGEELNTAQDSALEKAVELLGL